LAKALTATQNLFVNDIWFLSPPFVEFPTFITNFGFIFFAVFQPFLMCVWIFGPPFLRWLAGISDFLKKRKIVQKLVGMLS